MVDRLVFCCVVAWITFSSTGQAQTFDSGWVKITKADLDDLTISDNGVRVNNFVLSEGQDLFRNKANVLKFSCSGRNKAKASAHVTIQLVGIDKGGELVFALCAEPSFGFLSGERTEEIRKTILSPAGTLGDAVTVKYRIIIVPR